MDEVRPDRLSQGDGLPVDAVPDIPVQPPLGHHIDRAAEQVLQVLDEGDMVEETSSRFTFDEEIDVALRGLLAPDGRAEEPDRTGAVTPAIRRISSRFSSTSAYRLI